MTETMAIELAPYNIQVNAVCPRLFYYSHDPAILWTIRKHRAWIEGRIPLSRWGTNADLAGPMLFLASPASDYVYRYYCLKSTEVGWRVKFSYQVRR